MLPVSGCGIPRSTGTNRLTFVLDLNALLHRLPLQNARNIDDLMGFPHSRHCSNISTPLAFIFPSLLALARDCLIAAWERDFFALSPEHTSSLMNRTYQRGPDRTTHGISRLGVIYRVMRCRDCYKETGSASPRCDGCKEKVKDRWKAWLDAGKCPRCQGMRDLNPKTQSCFECGFEVRPGDDYVEAIFSKRKPRLSRKWLGKD
jgi:hypothetical protein